MVSGVAALLMSVEAERGLKPSGAKVRKILLASCAPPSDDQIEIASTQLAGRLDVGRALDLLLGPSATLKEKEDHLTTASLPRIETYQPQCIFPQGQEDDARASDPASNMGQDEALVPAHGDCGCGCGGQDGECTCGGAQKTQLVYAIGRLGVSFISQTRRDSIWRLVNGSKDGDLKPISDEALQRLFQKQAFQSQSGVWTLSRTEVPITRSRRRGPSRRRPMPGS
jgi:hypothetical protein